jgi:curved DNA-binding protein CbpA
MPLNYYEILEVQPDADVALIKSQYRKLVRQYHPDIAEDKDAAHARMQLILEAYNTLSDADKRAHYDRSLSSPAPSPAPRPAPRSSQRAPSRSSGRYEPRSGRVTSGQSDYSSPSSSAGSLNPRTRLLTMVFEAANLYFEDGRAGEAIAICERVMKADSSNAEAPALLGDIYADQGRHDMALLMYERAMRRRPDNLSYRQKYESLRLGDGAPVPQPKGGPKVGANAKRPAHLQSKKGGCGAHLLFWLFLAATAATPFLVSYLAGP